MQVDVTFKTNSIEKRPLRLRNAKDSRNSLSLLSLASMGAAAMYFLDPDRGNRRRKLVTNQLTRARRVTGDAIGTTARDLRNRTQGLMAVARSGLKVGKRKPKQSQESDNQRTPRRWEFAQTHWTPAARLMGSLAGAALTLYAFRRRGAVGSVVGTAGAALITRGLTNLPMKRLTGVTAGRRAIDIQKTITINAPVGRVFSYFTDWENWPQWMSHVQKVRVTGSENDQFRTHWAVDGPAGSSIEWDAITTSLIPEEELAWKSVEGSTVQHAGVIRFRPTSDGATVVDLKMSYNPPAGAIGHTVANVFSRDPKHQLDDDLSRLKTTIETGSPPHDAVM